MQKLAARLRDAEAERCRSLAEARREAERLRGGEAERLRG